MSRDAQIRTAKLATAFKAWVDAVPATGGIVSGDVKAQMAEADRLYEVVQSVRQEIQDAAEDEAG